MLGIPCVAPKQLLTCVNPCEKRCSDLSKKCINVQCIESCACPTNMLEQDGKCVPKSDCRCTWNTELLGPKPQNYNEESPPDTVVTKECNNW